MPKRKNHIQKAKICEILVLAIICTNVDQVLDNIAGNILGNIFPQHPKKVKYSSKVCEYCQTHNKLDETNCVNCGAVLK